MDTATDVLALRKLSGGIVHLLRRPGRDWEISHFERTPRRVFDPIRRGYSLHCSKLCDPRWKGLEFGTVDEAAEYVRKQVIA